MPSVDDTSTQNTDQTLLDSLGHKTEFRREMGVWENFALGFTYLSPVVGVYSLFGFALATGGPPMIWAIVIAAVGQLMVALIFGEVVSQLPISGGIYPWCKRLWGKKWAWIAAWIYMLALMVTIAAVAYGAGPYLSALFGVASSQQITVIFAIFIVACVALINIGGTKLLSKVAIAGFSAELIGVIVIGVWLLATEAHHSPAVIFDSFNVAKGGSYFAAFAAASLIGVYLFYGFEACGDVAEEVIDPGRKIPRAMRLTIFVGGFGALFITFALLLAVPDYTAVFAGSSGHIVETILRDAFGPIGYRVVIVVVLISFFSCALSLQAAASRLVYSYARDGMIPFSNELSYFSQARQIPLGALLLAAALPIIVILISMISVNALTIIISFGALGIYLAFMAVTIAALRAKIKGWKPSGKFNLGSWSIVVNIVAILYQTVAAINMMWPRAPEAPWYQNYLVIISTSVVVLIGLIYMSIFSPYKKDIGGAHGDVKEISRTARTGGMSTSSD